MAGWGKLVVGALIGVAGTVYATNEELRKKLPGAARDLPVAIRQRVESAISAGRAASSKRREEILRDLEQHGGGQHAARGVQPDPDEAPPAPPGATDEGAGSEKDQASETLPEDATQPAARGKQDERNPQG